jgi:PKD repeat protein
VGTEVGVFGTSDNGAHWSTGNDGPANVAVNELFWMGSKLVAVTHGRGMFSITPLLGGVNLVNNGYTLSGGNTNQNVDPNECSQVTLAIANVGGATASNITATLTTSTPGVNISQGVSTYPTITNGTSANNSTPFQMSTSPSFTCGTTVTLTLNVTYAGGSNVLTYALPSGSTNYTLTTSTGASIVPGVTDVGNHDDDTTTTIALPFAYTFYGQTYNSVTLDSNGRLNFSGATSQYQNSCLPAGYPATVDAFWDDLRTDGTVGTAQGIYTSTSGSAPNRIFNIEWRASYYSSSKIGNPVNFEVRLYEGQLRLDFIYGTLNGSGSSATVGIENNSSAYVQYGCNSGVLSSGLQLTFQQSCADGGGQCFVAPPVASFSGAPTNGFAPLAVIFTNLTTGATNYLWDFGNSATSTNLNPANTYSNAGTYSVKLTAVGAGGTNTLTRTNYIVVQTPASLLVSPASLNFGLLNTGATAQASFVVSNGGAGTLNGSAALSAGPFSITSGTLFTVGATLSTNVVVKFAPVSSGVFSNAVIFISNGGNSTNTVLGRATARPVLISQPPAGGNYDFTFVTLSGFTYVVQYKDVLTNPVWQTLQTVPGDGLMHIVTNSLASPAQRFYRLMVQ